MVPVLLLAALLGSYTVIVSMAAQLSVLPREGVIANGKSAQFTCTSTASGVIAVKLFRESSVVSRRIHIATLDVAKQVATVVDSSQTRITAISGTSNTALIVNYTSTTCNIDAYSYICEFAFPLSQWSPLQTLTILDFERFSVTSLELSDPTQCPGDIAQAECDLCNQHGTSMPVRNKGDTLAFTCEADLLFPSERPNTFRWYTRDINGGWLLQADEFSPARTTATTTAAPRTLRNFCYNSTEAHTDTFEFTPEDSDPRILKVRCEVTFEYKGLVEKREKVLSLCVIGGKEPPATTTTTPGPKKTTPKTEGNDNIGFSLTTGPGIALLVACVVVVVAAIGGAGFWVYRRQHRAPAQENADDYYADGGENYA